MRSNIIPLATRMRVIHRDKFTCYFCKKTGVLVKRYGRPAVVEPINRAKIKEGQVYNGQDCIPFTCHHLTPVALGGEQTVDNIVLACRDCSRSRSYLKEAHRIAREHRGD